MMTVPPSPQAQPGLMSKSLYLAAAFGAMVACIPAASAQKEYENKARTPSIQATPIPPTLEAQQTKVAKGMSPIDVLMVERAIKENWANYTLLDDGDGVALRQEYWAKFTFTKDYKWVWYDAAGHTIGEVGYENFVRQPLPGVVQRPWKHLPITIKFDEITPTTARTRTVMLFMAVPKATVSNRPDGAEGLSTPAVPQAGMAIYHENWRKESGIWLKASTIVYSANCGWFPTPVGDFSCVDPKVTSQPNGK
jgi:hypothetical protein